MSKKTNSFAGLVFFVTNSAWGYGTEGTYQELAEMWHSLGWSGFILNGEKIITGTGETIAVVKRE